MSRSSTRKRAAPQEVENIPPTTKRTKSEASNASSNNSSKASKASRSSKTTTKTTRKASGAAKTNGTKKVAAPRVRAPPRGAINQISAPPEHPRPPNQLFVWGAGNFGQFGMGPEHLDEFDKPRKNTWIEKKIDEGAFGGEGAGIESVVAGGLHTMFIDEKGTIWTCGVNDDAALGRITKDVPDPEHEGQFLDVDYLTAFPHPLQSLVDENFRAVSIAAGDSICAAISSDGELRVWGSFRANEGSLGFASGLKYQFLPVPILHLSKDEKVVSVAAGNNHLVVLTTHGNIYTWGAGEQGQLGRKILERRKIHGTTPEKVTLHARTTKAVTVGAGNYASFAVDEHGTTWGWGLNNMGQTGTGFERAEDDAIVPQPAHVVGLSKDELGGATVVQIAGGEHHTLFLTSVGEVFACGRATAGQLGLPAGHPALSPTSKMDIDGNTAKQLEGLVAIPTRVPFPDSAEDDPVLHISAGTHNNLAVTRAGALYSWGQGAQGELGLGDATEVRAPKMIVRKEGGSWKAIAAACGGQHSLGMFRKKAA